MATKTKPLPLLRTSERAAFKRCPQRWWWGWREGLKPTGQEKQPLWFGTGIHLAFAEYYIPGTKRGRPLQETWTEYCKGHYESVRVSSTYRGDEEDAWEDALTLGLAMFDYYDETYDGDPHWEIIAPEQVFALLIPHPDDRTHPLIDYRGTFDGVYRNLETGDIWLLEHKSAAVIDTGHLPLDDQGGSYISVATHILRQAGILGPKEFIKGVMYNFLAKRRPSTKPRDEQGRYRNQPTKAHFVREIIHQHGSDGETDEDLLSEKYWMKKTLAQLKETAAMHKLEVWGDISKIQPKDTLLREPITRTPKEIANQIKRIGEEALSMRAYRNKRLPLYKTPTKDCKWDCDFFELCQVHETGGDVEEFKQLAFTVQDPYADHRAGATNSKESLASSRG